MLSCECCKLCLAGTNASTHFKSETVKINVYPITFDKVLQR